MYFYKKHKLKINFTIMFITSTRIKYIGQTNVYPNHANFYYLGLE